MPSPIPTQHRPLRAALLCTLLLLASAGCATTAQRSTAETAALKAKAMQQAPAVAAQALAAGDAAFRKGALDDALVQYVKALTATPGSVEAFCRIARTHDALGDFNTAAGAYRKALALDPAHIGAAEGLGLVLLQQRRLPEARISLQKAVAKNPKLWRSLNGLGVIADLQGDYRLAETQYSKALALSPNQPAILNNLGYSRYLAGRFPEAQGYYERVLAIAPNDAKAWSNLALVQARRGDSAQSVAAFRELMPEAEAYYSAGYVTMLDRRYAEAEQLFQRAIELSPVYYAAAHDNRARARLEARRAAPVTAAPAPAPAPAAAKPKIAAVPVKARVAAAAPKPKTEARPAAAEPAALPRSATLAQVAAPAIAADPLGLNPHVQISRE